MVEGAGAIADPYRAWADRLFSGFASLRHELDAASCMGRCCDVASPVYGLIR